jgi:hypothetical protein
LGLAFGAAWLWFAVLWLVRAPLGPPAGQLLLLPSGFVPAAAAIIVRRWVTREGFADAALGIRLRTWPYSVNFEGIFLDKTRTYTVRATARLYANDGGIVQVGEWIEDNLRYKWWAELAFDE